MFGKKLKEWVEQNPIAVLIGLVGIITNTLGALGKVPILDAMINWLLNSGMRYDPATKAVSAKAQRDGFFSSLPLYQFS